MNKKRISSFEEPEAKKTYYGASKTVTPDAGSATADTSDLNPGNTNITYNTSGFTAINTPGFTSIKTEKSSNTPGFTAINTNLTSNTTNLTPIKTEEGSNTTNLTPIKSEEGSNFLGGEHNPEKTPKSPISPIVTEDGEIISRIYKENFKKDPTGTCEANTLNSQESLGSLDPGSPANQAGLPDWKGDRGNTPPYDHVLDSNPEHAFDSGHDYQQ